VTIDTQSYAQLKHEIAERIVADRAILDQLRDEIRPLRSETRHIQPRTTYSLSLVAADGGNNSLRFDPFLIHLVRVVDSKNNEYVLEAITPSTNVTRLSRQQFHDDGSPRTQLGEMMAYLDVTDLRELSPMIRSDSPNRPASLTWVKTYRELVEWAILFSKARKHDSPDNTLIIYDGLLRSKAFSKGLFQRFLHGIQEGIDQQRQQYNRQIYLAGVAKQSKVLDRYRLAMALEGILTTSYPAYIAVPANIQRKAHTETDYIREVESEDSEDEVFSDYVGGAMFFVKFGSGVRDPIWPVDIFRPQKGQAQQILGAMLTDAINGFPVPLYPHCLQKAHENAALVDFDFDILQNHIFDGIRQVLAEEATVLDTFRLQNTNPAQLRYER
jgi:hypothetical protein